MLKRLFNIFMGWFGLGVKSIENASPQALLELEKNKLAQNEANFSLALAKHAGSVEKLNGESLELGNEERDLTLKIEGLLELGKEELASKLVLKLNDVKQRHDAIHTQLKLSDEKYHQLIGTRDTVFSEAREKIERIENNLNDLSIVEAVADSAEAASGSVSMIGSSSDTLNRIDQVVKDRKNLAAGRARVANDSVNKGDREAEDAMKQLLAKRTLEEFKQKRGLTKTLPQPDPLAEVLNTPIKTIEKVTA